MYTTIQIPAVEITSNSRFFTIYNNGDSQHPSYKIGVNSNITQMLAFDIVEKEIKIIKEFHPEVDLDRVQEMIHSGDREMNDLAYSILNEHSKYCVEILQLMKFISSDGVSEALENVVRKYIDKNKLNITGRVL